jgi:hypothetical protein
LQISKLIEATDLVLPRFQRKSTWGAKKDFLLALSFFKGLPLGTIVIKDSDASTPGSPRYLLDGRQRWEALKGIRDPETVYGWAKTAIGIRAKWSEQQLTEGYLTAIDNYFGSDPSEEIDALVPEVEAEDDEASATAELSETYGGTSSSPTGDPGLDELLEILLLAHPVTSKDSRLGRSFGFHDLVQALPYIDSLDSGAKRVNPIKLREWITFRRKISGVEGDVGIDDFLQWLTNGQPLEAATDAALRARIGHEWGTISAAIRLNGQVESRLEQTVIAALVLNATTASEDAKIFEIINTGGTKLTAAEVLSATHQWRVTIPEPNSRLLGDAADLYDAMGVEPADGAVRWDVPATILSRLDSPAVLGRLTGPTPRTDTRRFERRITLGFQILAGWYAGKIAKDHVESLPKTAPGIEWSSTALEDTLNGAIRVAVAQDQFKYWESWQFSIIDLMSDAVALNFLLSMAIDWDRKGRPTVDGADLRTYRRNARTLLDRLIYEYCMGIWRGSSDSRIASNIVRLRAGEDAAFEPVPDDDWVRLMEEVATAGTILGADYREGVDNRIKLLLCYRQVVRRSWQAPGPSSGYEFDHIIPSAEFGQLPTGTPAKRLENHIANLAVLPPRLNRAKSDKTLAGVVSDADKEAIALLIDVPVVMFEEMSSAGAAQEVVDYRSPRIIDDLTSTRASHIQSAITG